MKFGKRLAAEAARRWRQHYLDYKVVKKAIQDDVVSLGEPILSKLQLVAAAWCLCLPPARVNCVENSGAIVLQQQPLTANH